MEKATSKSWSALAVCALLMSGCYRYVPTDFTATPVGEDLRLVVVPDRIEELSEIRTGDDAAPVIDGTLMGREGNELLFRVRVGSRQEGLHTVGFGQAIRVPSDAVLAAQLRVPDKPKTIAAVAGSVIGTGLLVLLTLEVRKEDTKLPDVDPEELRTTLISIPIG